MIMIILLLTALQDQVSPAPPPSEMEILEVGLASLPQVWPRPTGAGCEVADETRVLPDGWHKRSVVYVNSEADPKPRAIPQDLIDATAAVNREARSLKILPLPKGTQLARGPAPDTCRTFLSRPGLSVSGTEAIVPVKVEQETLVGCMCASGFLLYLERRERGWALVAIGGYWLTECVCTSDK